MKKILLALLSLILVLCSSCDNEVKETAPEPDYANNRTTIALYVDGKECKQDRIGIYEMYLKTISKDKLSESITLTVKNTGDNPAKINVIHREYFKKVSVESAIPEILQPGESADLRFTYASDADKGVTPGFIVGDVFVGGNFPGFTVCMRGKKVDVPLLNVRALYDKVNTFGIVLGVDTNPPSYIRLNDFNAAKSNTLMFDYNFMVNEEIHSKVDSIEVVGQDAEFFKSIDFSDNRISIEFNPTEKREHEAIVRIHVLSSDFNEYIRDLPIVIDVQSINDSFFVSNEYCERGNYSAIYTITPSSNGHAYILVENFEIGEGFIEIDDNDRFVARHVISNNTNKGMPVDSWLDEATNTLYVLVGLNNNGKLIYGIETYDIKNDTANGVKEISELEYSLWKYLGQSDDFLMFMKSNGLKFVDKHDYSIITLVEDKNDFIGLDGEEIHLDFNITPANKIIYDNESDIYIIAGVNYINLVHFDKNSGFTEGRKLHLGSDFSGSIKDVINVPGGFYVLNDFNQIFKVTITDLNCKVELIDVLPEYAKISICGYANEHLYLFDETEYEVNAYDISSRKLIPICKLQKPSQSNSSYYLKQRNGNVYYSTSIDQYLGNISHVNGYVRRIPLI